MNVLEGNPTSIYMDINRRRIDEFDDERRISTVIADNEAGFAWSVSWSTMRGSVVELPEYVFATRDPRDELEWEIDGEETFNGFACVRYLHKEPDFQMKLLITKDTDFQIYQENCGPNGQLLAQVICSDVVIGPPPPEVFEIPQGIQFRNSKS